jgi:hypothetical protein
MKGLERLHFFNGQRLAAKDLELEQKYHLRVRRLLNRGLYSAGVVNGLEVSKVDPKHVKVTTGMALDPRGREVILLSDAMLRVPAGLPTAPAPGYFLVIHYNEETEPGTLADCREGIGTTPPARTSEYPSFSWTESWPNHQECGKGHAADCGVVLALVTLTQGCQIDKIEPAVRQYAHSTLPSVVHPFALEGEKDIDSANSKVIHFQVRGGIPDVCLLFLWGGAISSLLYTELGSHAHKIGSVVADSTASDLGNHSHGGGSGLSDAAGMHNHTMRITEMNTDGLAAADFWGTLVDPGAGLVLGVVRGLIGLPPKNDAILSGPNPADPFGMNPGAHVSRGPTAGANQGDPAHDYIQPDGQHTHKVSGGTTGAPSPDHATAHKHTLSGTDNVAGNTRPPAGTPYQARDGKDALSFPALVHVKVDDIDYTKQILIALGWGELGDGTKGHKFVKSGTGAIDLMQLAVPMGTGPHKIELLVNGGGGKVLYNLYVE